MENPAEAIKSELGRVQVYTGDAKGKTTACVGLAVRAAGHGLRTYMGQFMKARPTGELTAIRKHLGDYIEIEQYGRGGFVCAPGPPEDMDYDLAVKGLARAGEKLRSGEYHIVILDEINVAVSFGLVTVYDLEKLIIERPERVELVLSGRNAHPRIIELADLVTEMRMIKHYFNQGLASRIGIEE